MFEIQDIIDFYTTLIEFVSRGTLSQDSPLDMIVLRVAWDQLAYVDNRREARRYGFDFWRDISDLKTGHNIINKGQMYSESQEFPDFVFKTRLEGGRFICGSLLETKDTVGGTISSFNSTIPTGTKSLQEIDAINNSAIVSRLVKLKDRQPVAPPEYFNYLRHCFYLIRTHKNSVKRKTSLVHGSFFETVSKDYLISQMFLNILEEHRRKGKVQTTDDKIFETRQILKNINDQTIIASSQSIENASIKPRLRLMAEVNPEGNPHNPQHYPEIQDGSINLLLPQHLMSQELAQYTKNKNTKLNFLTLQHKRNGKYAVIQFLLNE